MARYVLSGLCMIWLVLYAVFGDDNPCTGAPDGKQVSISCSGSTICTNQAPVVVTCQTGTVLERDSLTCKPIGTGNTICGTSGTCEGTGFRPSPNCQSFFHCQNDTFADNNHVYCPGNLLFFNGTCNFPSNVPQPCGIQNTATTVGVEVST